MKGIEFANVFGRWFESKQRARPLKSAAGSGNESENSSKVPFEDLAAPAAWGVHFKSCHLKRQGR